MQSKKGRAAIRRCGKLTGSKRQGPYYFFDPATGRDLGDRGDGIEPIFWDVKKKDATDRQWVEQKRYREVNAELVEACKKYVTSREKERALIL